MQTNRRDFLKTMGFATVCACTGLAGLNGCSMIKGVSSTAVMPEDSYQLAGNELTIFLDKADCLKQTGGAGKISLTSEDEIKIIVVHHEPGKYKAFSDRCTHGGRELNYQHEKGQLQCSSFGHSSFKLSNGHVIKGPAEGPLAIYPVQIIDNSLKLIIA
jgi:nitrite reductase/ring-hydroxylating ferredoxin subunit